MASIFVAGDVVNYGNDTGLVCTDELAKIIANADYSVCNFEAPVAGYGSPQTKSGPHHCQRVETIKGLHEQGFNLLLLANNHVMDYGTEGLTKTIELAHQVGLDTVGAGVSSDNAYMPLIKDIDGIKIGIINACEAQFGVIDQFERSIKSGYAWINHPLIDKNILELKMKCDFVLVFAHAGLEKYNIPQKEWRQRYKHFCELGADVVIGSHPHVPQGYERHNNSLIFYSLGNFYFDGGGYKNSPNKTYSIILDLVKDKIPEFTPVFNITVDGKVGLCTVQDQIDLELLCRLLDKNIYSSLHDEMILDAYKVVNKYIKISSNKIPSDGTFKGTIKEVLATFMGKRKGLDKSIMQLHILRNETYYYTLKHALELENKHKF